MLYKRGYSIFRGISLKSRFVSRWMKQMGNKRESLIKQKDPIKLDHKDLYFIQLGIGLLIGMSYGVVQGYRDWKEKKDTLLVLPIYLLPPMTGCGGLGLIATCLPPITHSIAATLYLEQRERQSKKMISAFSIKRLKYFDQFTEKLIKFVDFYFNNY